MPRHPPPHKKKTVGRTTGNSSSSWRERREGGTEVEDRLLHTSSVSEPCTSITCAIQNFYKVITWGSF